MTNVQPVVATKLDWVTLLNDPDIAEIGGENNNDGVDYSRYWAMALLIDLELKNKDYAIVFEYLQDVAALDSPTDPKQVVLYQVKKKASGEWTRASLCRGEKAEAISDAANATAAVAPTPVARKASKKKLLAESPLGKLLICVEKTLPLAACTGTFVSNAAFGLKLKNGTSLKGPAVLNFANLHLDDWVHIHNKLRKELSRTGDLDKLGLISVEESGLPLKDVANAIVGRLDSFLRDAHNGLSAAGQIRERLLQAFSHLSGSKGTLSNFEQVVAQKGFTRGQFQKLIGEFANKQSHQAALDAVVSDLKNDGMLTRVANAIQQEANRQQIEFTHNPASRDVLHWNDALAAAKAHKELGTYLEMIKKVAFSLAGKEVETKSVVPTEIKIIALSILAIIHVEQQSTPPN